MRGSAGTFDRAVVVIGAGLAGGGVAAALAGRGWDVLLLERKALPRHKVCGEFLSPEAQESLRALALYQTVLDLEPAILDQARLISPGGAVTTLPLPGYAWGLSRYALDAALAEAAVAQGATVQTGVTVTAVSPVGRGFQVEGRSAEGRFRLRSRAVIAAGGRHTRPGLPPPTRPAAKATQVGLKGHYEGVAMPSRVELFFFPGGYVGLNPVEGGRINLCLLTQRDPLAQAGGDLVGLVRWLQTRHPALRQRLAGARLRPETTAAVAPVDTGRPATPWAGFPCLGDTAVMVPPLCGDGMAMALRSAEICAPLADAYLREQLSLAGWEAAYRTAWQAAFARPVRVGRWLQTLLSLPLAADALLGLGRLVPSVAAALLRATRSRRARRSEK